MPEAGAAEQTRSGTVAEEGTSTRRSFLERVSTGWALFTAASATGLIATARFMFPNDLFEPPTKFRIGFPAEYEAGKEGVVNEKWKAKYQK